MDFNQVKEIAGRYWSSLVDSWFVIVSILGVVALVLSQIFTDPVVSKIFLTVGSVVVATGCFSAFTRWISVHGIVKKEMQNILFGDEYLQTKQGFDVVWSKLVSSSINQNLPGLARFVHKDFLMEYFPAKGDLFYKEYHHTLDVYWHDKDRRVVKVKDRCEILVEAGNSSAHPLRFTFNASVPVGRQLSYVVTAAKIDAECHLDKVKSVKSSAGLADKISISWEVELVGKTEYRYFRSMERLISLDYEPFIEVGNSRHTFKPRVTINCHDDGLKAYFTSTGTLKNFVTIEGSNNSGYMEEQYPELMLRFQGYTIYFSEAKC
ncbi:hypothetical protein LJD21_01640 [Pseudomonas inefficax]|uniref:hypothetical protein n=1 Tax=Pseudomonas inefficax TaxID=2078786 RepID=UPI00207BC727|nr:hypothetical protein [Pseudomonas inefficax]MCM8910873.1 hypothetical protein [Pseudomonas inefficax]